MARNYLPARGMELRLRFFRVLMCIFVVLFVLFWTVLTISRSRFLFKAPHTIFICIFYNKHHSASVIYPNKNVVQSTTFSVFTVGCCSYHNKAPALTAPLARPSKTSFVRTHPTPPHGRITTSQKPSRCDRAAPKYQSKYQRIAPASNHQTKKKDR